ncbi:MAG: SH3 domain-containing protein, partial [Bacteroidota bacterium]
MSHTDKSLSNHLGKDQLTEFDGLNSSNPPPLNLTASPPDQPNGNGTGNHGFPYIGMVKEDAWSSGFYTAPDKATKSLDLPKGTSVEVTGKNGGWLQVVILDGENKGTKGYISAERVENVEVSRGIPRQDLPLEMFTQNSHLSASGGKIQLGQKRGNGIFYAEEGEKLWVAPTHEVAIDASTNEAEYESVVYAFKNRGLAEITALYITYPGDEQYDAVNWYNSASADGMFDIWAGLLTEFSNSASRPAQISNIPS